MAPSRRSGDSAEARSPRPYCCKDPSDRQPLRAHRPRRPRLPRRRDLRGRGTGSLLCRAGGPRRRRHGRAGGGAGDGGHGPGAPRRGAARAKCCCTTIRAAGSSPRHPTSTWPPGCTTVVWASASSTTTPPRSTSSSKCRTTRIVLGIDPFDVIDTLGERGPVAQQLGQYEDRPSQRDMAAYIADALQRRRRRRCSRRGPGSGSRSPIWCPRSPGRAPTASAPW